MMVATCDLGEQLHKFVHGHFFLFVSESGLDDRESPPSRISTVSPRRKTSNKNQLKARQIRKCLGQQPSSEKGKKHKFNIKPRFS